MMIMKKKQFLQRMKTEGGTVLEVTTKQLYVIPKRTHASINELKKEWFEEYENRSHAFKDANLVSGSNEVIEIKEL